MARAEDEIRQLIEQRIDAMRRKDANAAVARIAENAVTFELAPPLALTDGEAADADALAAWLAGFEELDVEVRDLRIEADTFVAFAYALHHLTGTRVGGAPVSLWMRSTLCFYRDIAGWIIVHAHTSVPFYMDGSFRAAVDLEP
jgi:ketosteroid isomerase-like protein